MSENNSAESAFPQTQFPEYAGLTKREYFAALAMQGLLASTTEEQYADQVKAEKPLSKWASEIALASVAYTDALLKELEK